MGQTTAQMRDFAARLVAYEAAGRKSAGTHGPGDFSVCAKLRPQLATLTGNTGYHALLSRALARAMTEVPSLRTVAVGADGSLVAADTTTTPAAPAELARGDAALAAQLLGLLEDFIGENLMRRIVCETWPILARNDVFLRTVDHEKFR